MEEADYFELHYHLRRGSHSMDALVRNKCERELLAIAFEIARQFDVPISIETYAYQEGGLRELWKAIGKNSNQLMFIVGVLAMVLSRVPMPDSELDKLEIQAKRLEIQKTELEIERLEEERRESKSQLSDADQGLATGIQRNAKIAVRRSNFYKTLVQYDKVESVGYRPRAKDPLPPAELIVERRDFAAFILASDKLPVQVDDDAQIEVFAPVLTDGNYHWRGYYLGKPISFTMLDPDFKAEIIGKKIQFRNGTRLKCVLHIHRKYDEFGEVAVTGYSVPTVLDLSESGVDFVETLQGRTYRRAKALRESQGDMFPDC